MTKYESSDEDNEEVVDDEREESEGRDSSDGGEARDSSDGSEAPGGGNETATADISLKPKEKADSSRIDDLWASFKQDVGIPPKEENVVPPSSGDKVCRLCKILSCVKYHFRTHT